MNKVGFVDRFLRVPEIVHLLGCKDRLVWYYFAEKLLPRRKHPTGRRITGCLLSDVQKFIAESRGDKQ